MLIKKKQDYDIYDRVDDVLKDTEDCQHYLKELNLMIDSEKRHYWDPDSPRNDYETFLTAEKDFIMFQSLEWINKRAEQKKNDKIFMDKFVP